MKEELIQFAWKALAFNFRNLRTSSDEKVEIIFQGFHNNDAGPDFSNARLMIGNLEWLGAVEIHVSTGDWYLHGHHKDPAYNSVVLHVVLHPSGDPVYRQDGTIIPEISLDGRIQLDLANCYFGLQLSENKVPCGKSLGKVNPLVLGAWLDRLGCTRLQKKATDMGERSARLNQDWEQLAWEEIAAALGGKTNCDAFRGLAQAIPVSILRKYLPNHKQVEALLMGASGMFSGNAFKSEEIFEMKNEWDFLRIKHSLNLSVFPFRNGKTRPASSPWVRMAQLIALVQQFRSLVYLISDEGINEFRKREISSGKDWKSLVRFGYLKDESVFQIGEEMKSHILINCLLPLKFLFGQAYGHNEVCNRAREILETSAPENNRITRMYGTLNVKPANALQSQGMIVLHQQYCSLKNCLTCSPGYHILKYHSAEWKSTPSSSSEQALKEESPWTYSTKIISSFMPL